MDGIKTLLDSHGLRSVGEPESVDETAASGRRMVGVDLADPGHFFIFRVRTTDEMKLGRLSESEGDRWGCCVCDDLNDSVIPDKDLERSLLVGINVKHNGHFFASK